MFQKKRSSAYAILELGDIELRQSSYHFIQGAVGTLFSRLPLRLQACGDVTRVAGPEDAVREVGLDEGLQVSLYRVHLIVIGEVGGHEGIDWDELEVMEAVHLVAEEGCGVQCATSGNDQVFCCYTRTVRGHRRVMTRHVHWEREIIP